MAFDLGAETGAAGAVGDGVVAALDAFDGAAVCVSCLLQLANTRTAVSTAAIEQIRMVLVTASLLEFVAIMWILLG
jgi:predicted homoserine dehydrogenase-like protein